MKSAEQDESFPAIVIGASVGAIEALSQILPVLPKNYPYAVMVVVHIPRQGDSLLPKIFAERCNLSVKEAEDKESITPGVIYFAPPDYHLLVNPDFTLSLSSDEPVLYSRPSVDVLFESAAEAFGDELIGIILTGANEDGAQGTATIAARGGSTIAQNPETSEGAAMPIAAINAVPQTRVMDLHDIAKYLQTIGNYPSQVASQL